MRFFVLIFFCSIFSSIHAQPPGGDPNGGGAPGSVPITGIEYLLGIGGLYGLKRIIDKSKNKTIE